MKRNLYFLLLLCVSIQLYGQNKFVSSTDLFGQRVFIKNNGQFDGILPQGKSVDYAYSNGEEQVYFNKNGVTYLLQEKYPLRHWQMEALEHGKKIEIKPSKKAFVDVSWEHSNPNVEIIVSDKQSHYQSYGDAKLKSECYKKITYKNIYDNIDIEYVFTNERKDGIKYTIVVHPGGNVDDIKIKYAGDIKKVVLKKGNAIIKTDLRNVTELAPVSFQDEVSIVSNFSVESNSISFEFPNSYDTTKDLMIDPWVINFTTLTNNNYGFDVDYDYAGNYYVYGGTAPFHVAKYSPTGVLLWTFNGSVPSINWVSNPVGNYTSNFIVDKVSGKSYTGQGFNPGEGTKIIRLDSSGIYDNLVSIANPLWNEIWDFGYNCASGNIFGLGGGTSGTLSAGVLNTTTAAISPTTFTNLSSSNQDIVCSAIDADGTFYFLYATVANPALDNTLLKVNSTFNGNIWSLMPTNYNSFNESDNKIYPGSDLGGLAGNGYNALDANNSYLYYYDGLNLAAYNKANGVRIAFVTLPAQGLLQQGGIAVDECNNIYVGGNGFIRCFNFNGTTFVPNGSIPIASTSPLQYVTDIKLKQGSNELYVSGSGFGGIYPAINSGSCSSASVGLVQTQVGINNTTVLATITTSVVAPIISYTWLNSSNVVVSQTNNSAALTNTVTNLANGTYSVVAQFNAPCGFTTTQTFVVNATSNTPIFTQVNAICSGSFLAALPTTSTNGIVGSWAPPINNTTTTTYTFTPNPGQDASTVTMTITVSDIIVPTFTQVAPICSGTFLANLPTTSNNLVGGTWSPAINNLQTTIYTFTPATLPCATTVQMTIVVNPSVVPVFTQVSSICIGGLLSNLPTTSNNFVAGNWSPAMDNTQTTVYTFTPNIGQCSSAVQMTIVVNPIGIPIFSQVAPICSGSLLLNLPTTSENFYAGTWSPPVNNLQTTTYDFAPSIGQCASAVQMTIVVNPIGVPTFTQIQPICYQGIIPTLPLSDANGILGTWQPTVVSNTASGNYIFTPTIGQCTSTNFNMPITVFDAFDFEIKQACVGSDFVLQVAPLQNSFALNQANFSWTDSNILSVGTNSPTFNVTNYFRSNSILPQFPLSYSVEVTLANGCSESHDVSLTSLYCSIQKGISPNDDGKNEFFDLQLLDVKKLEIFNRYGTKVYSKSNYLNEWVGQCDDGGILPDGVYYYVIDFNDNKSTKVGWIYLTR